MENNKIYSLKQIEGACVIGSPVVAGILIFNNYKNFCETQKGVVWIFIGILWTLGLIGFASLIPENILNSIGVMIPVINGLILYPIINKLQGERIKEHFNSNWENGSNWFVAGLIVFVVVLILTPTILLDRISPINNYNRLDFESNGIYYNTEMPLDEVNKLGNILKRIQYFNPINPTEVVFSRSLIKFQSIEY